MLGRRTKRVGAPAAARMSEWTAIAPVRSGQRRALELAPPPCTPWEGLEMVAVLGTPRISKDFYDFLDLYHDIY